MKELFIVVFYRVLSDDDKELFHQRILLFLETTAIESSVDVEIADVVALRRRVDAHRPLEPAGAAAPSGLGPEVDVTVGEVDGDPLAGPPPLDRRGCLAWDARRSSGCLDRQ